MSDDAVSQLLLHSVNQGDLHQAQMLILEGGANVNFRNMVGEAAIHVAALRGNCPMVELLLGFGADPNVSHGARYGGKTPLHIGVEQDCLNLVTLLLNHDADPNIPDTFGKVPLHKAAQTGKTTMVKLLLTGGAAPDISDAVDFTPWHYAKQMNYVDIVKLLPAKPDVPYAQRREEVEKRLIWKDRKGPAPKK